MNPTRKQIIKHSKVLERVCTNENCKHTDTLANFDDLCPKCGSKLMIKLEFNDKEYQYDIFSNKLVNTHSKTRL